MTYTPTILIYGRDERLSQTRQWVLEHAAFLVLTAFDLEQVKSILISTRIDLLILCHSLTEKDCHSGLTVAHQLRPEMENLILSSDLPNSYGPNRDAILSAFADPRTLIATVVDLISKRPAMTYAN